MAKKITLLRIKMTKEAIEKLTPPPEGRRYVYDSAIRGLALCITHTDRRTWYLYRKIDGKPERVRIGTWPEFTVRQAQDEAERIRGRVASGDNPAEERRLKRLVPTLAEQFDAFIGQPSRAKEKKPRSDRTAAEYRHQHKKYLPSWHHRRIDKITKADVESLHGDLAAKCGLYTANRVLALLKAMLNMAVDDGVIAANGAARVKPLKEEKRKRRLTESELPAFFAAVECEPSPTLKDFFLLALFTGARRGNVASMAWADVNLETAEWIIPQTKNGESARIHLTDSALAILKLRKAGAGDCPWVFRGGKKNRASHLKSPKAAWAKLLERAKKHGTNLDGLRIHDLRRTLGSFQADAGSSLYVIGQSLGHRSQEATMIYARPETATINKSVDKAVANMLAAAKPKRRRKDTA